MFIHKISNSQASGAANYSFKIAKTSLKYGLQGSAYQPKAGFRLQTNDARILAATYQFGNIQYAHNSINHTTFAPSIMYGHIENLAAPIVKNNLISTDSLDFGYPAIAYMGNGSLDNTALLTFSHSSNTIYPGVSMVKVDYKGNPEEED